MKTETDIHPEDFYSQTLKHIKAQLLLIATNYDEEQEKFVLADRYMLHAIDGVERMVSSLIDNFDNLLNGEKIGGGK